MPGLAIAAAICAGIACCPLTSLAAIFLALGAMAQIRGARRAAGGATQPAPRGMRLVIVSLVVATASLLAQMWLLDWGASNIRQSTERELVRVVDTAMAAAQGGDGPAVLAMWATESDGPPLAAAEAFGEQTLRRYGAYQSFTTALSVPTRGSGGASFELAVTFEFARRDLTGSVRYTLVPTMNAFLPQPRLTEIVIDDDAGSLRLGGVVTQEPGAPEADPGVAQPGQTPSPEQGAPKSQVLSPES